MNSEQLRQQLAELRAQIEALLPTNAAEQYLAQWIQEQGEPFVSLQDAIIEVLLTTGAYSLKLEDEMYSIWWHDRHSPPWLIHYVKDWRSGRFGDHPHERRLGWRDSEAADVEEAAETVNDVPVPLEASESAQASAQGHSEQSVTPASSNSSVEPATTPLAPTATPATPATSATLAQIIPPVIPPAQRSAEEIAAEISAIQTRIAELEELQEMHQAGPTPPRRVVRPLSPSSSAATAASAKETSEWWRRQF